MPPGAARSLVAMLLPLLVLGLVVLVEAQQPARHLDEPEVYEIASQLRCVVCQNLSVADSPSETAYQMRGVIRERLASGERPDQVIQYFVDKYGEWILLEPRRHGFTLVVWLLPPLAAVAGIGLAAVLMIRWTRRRRRASGPAPTSSIDPAMSERIRRELADLGSARPASSPRSCSSESPCSASPSGPCGAGRDGHGRSCRWRPIRVSRSSSRSARFWARCASWSSSTRPDTSPTRTTPSCT